MSNSLTLANKYLHKIVTVFIDRPLGSRHPIHNFEYLVNYGYIDGVIAPDGEYLDAYYLGVARPIDKASGKVIAIIHRETDDDDKLVVVPETIFYTDEEIESAVFFQEKWFKHIILR